MFHLGPGLSDLCALLCYIFNEIPLDWQKNIIVRNLVGFYGYFPE